jgi:hypothetical protein
VSGQDCCVSKQAGRKHPADANSFYATNGCLASYRACESLCSQSITIKISSAQYTCLHGSCLANVAAPNQCNSVYELLSCKWLRANGCMKSLTVKAVWLMDCLNLAASTAISLSAPYFAANLLADTASLGAKQSYISGNNTVDLAEFCTSLLNIWAGISSRRPRHAYCTCLPLPHTFYLT